MKGRLVAFVGVFCIAMLFASGAYAGKPDKEPKEPKPGNITTECIVFTEDLESVPGGEVVEGCCPNAGPFPAYTMTLNVMGIDPDTYDGQLFINTVRTRVNRQWITGYKVQFSTWVWDIDTLPGKGDYFFEINGGDIVYDKTNDLLTVTFEDETATGWVYYDMNTDCDPCEPDCFPCTDVRPACDLCDPDCSHPCNEEITIEDVSFVLERTEDLSYCE